MTNGGQYAFDGIAGSDAFPVLGRAAGRSRTTPVVAAFPLDFAGGGVFVMSLRSALASAPSSSRTPARVDGVGMTAGRAAERN